MITFTSQNIEFANYPFSAVTIFPNGQLHFSEVSEVQIDSVLSEVRTQNGEILFIDPIYNES